jgi:hypothetical protein
MDSLDPPDEKLLGESALLQQVAVHMRKPFEPDDSLPETTMLLESFGENGGAQKRDALISHVSTPTSISGLPQSAHFIEVAPAPTDSAAPPMVLSEHSAAVKETPASLGADKDAAHSVVETSKNEIQAKAGKSEWNRTSTTDSLSLQMLVENKESQRERDPGGSNVHKSINRSVGEPGPQTDAWMWTRWLEMLHIGKSIQRGRSFLSWETILLFCVMSLIIGLLVWGVFCMWGFSSGSHEDADDAVKIPPNRSSRDQPVYAQQSQSIRQSSSRSIQPHHEAPSGSGRVISREAFPSVSNTSPRPKKELYREPGPTPNEMTPMQSLCPELIVPRGSECILVVHYLPPGQTQQVEFDILDINGEPVLKVEVQPMQSPGQLSDRFQQSGKHTMSSQRNRSPTIVLKSLQPRETTGGFVFAYCRISVRDDESGSKQQNVYIYKEDDELYAHLMKDDARKRYVLTSGHHGLQLLFEGNFEEHVVNVTNESGERIAATEPRVMHFDPTKFYKLRVAANADVGLVLCGLLMINQLEMSHARS